MSAKAMEALAELRLGVEMDAAHDPSGKKKLDALDEAMRAIEAADKARGGDVIDDMRAAVRFAPSSAYWSERLRGFFGPDARHGIDALEKQLQEARAALAAQAVDLEQFRDAVFCWRQICPDKRQEADRLLTLIDAQKEARNG